jgi:hypothetical protein
MPYFRTFSDPCMDLGGGSNMPPPPRMLRPVIAALRCSWLGHSWRLSGHANGHLYSWTDWRIGTYDSCECCRVRRFELEDRAQFDEVLKIERERWVEHFAQARERDAALISKAVR